MSSELSLNFACLSMLINIRGYSSIFLWVFILMIVNQNFFISIYLILKMHAKSL